VDRRGKRREEGGMGMEAKLEVEGEKRGKKLEKWGSDLEVKGGGKMDGKKEKWELERKGGGRKRNGFGIRGRGG